MTVTAAQTHTLLTCVVLLMALATWVWFGLARFARVTPRAAMAMSGANAAAGLSLALHASRHVLPDAFTYWPSDVLAIASLALLRAAAPAIAARHLVWRGAALAVLVSAGGLACLPYPHDLRWQGFVVCFVSAGLALQAALDALRDLRQTGVRRRASGWMSTPLFLIAGLLGARAADALLFPGHNPDLRVPTLFNLQFLWGALVLTVLQNATMAVLVLTRLVRRIEQLVERDPLTDALNRRAFSQALASAYAGLARGRGYAVVMFDMDRFKQLNDTLGHAAGDAALKHMVAAVQPCVREVDKLGRLGGEEFALLLPATDLTGAALVAERMRALLDSSPLEWEGQRWLLSASFGIAEAERGDTASEAVLARADAGLYRAKRQGRNVVQA